MNLKQLLPDMSLRSTIFGSEIYMSISSVAFVLNVSRDGFDRYAGDGWHTIVGVTTEQIYKFLFVVPYSTKASYQSTNLSEPITPALHSICNKVLILLTHGKGTVPIRETVLIYLVTKKIKIDLHAIISIDLIMNCCSFSHHTLA